MILAASTTVHDLLVGCPELRAYVEGLLPSGRVDGASIDATKSRRATTLADVARAVNLTHTELLRALQAEAVRLGVGDAVASPVESPLTDDDLEALVGLLEEGRGLLEVTALVRQAEGLRAAAARDVARGGATGEEWGPGGATARAGVTALAAAPPAAGVVAPPAPGAAAPPAPGVAVPPAPGPGAGPGHPLDTLSRELAAAEQVLGMLRSALAAIECDPAEWERVRPLVFRLLDLLGGLDRHHRRVVELVCPHLRRRDREGVSRLLGDAQAAVDRLRAEVRRQARAGDVQAAAAACQRLDEAVTEALRQEEYVLLPLAAATLGESEWREVRAGETAIGWSLIDTPPTWPARP